jgi:hypothetical protein
MHVQLLCLGRQLHLGSKSGGLLRLSNCTSGNRFQLPVVAGPRRLSMAWFTAHGQTGLIILQ